MSDNRVTSRFEPLLLSQLDTYRERFFMSRSDFVRHCVQMHLHQLSMQEGRQYKEMLSEIEILRRRISDLSSENDKLMSYIRG